MVGGSYMCYMHRLPSGGGATCAICIGCLVGGATCPILINEATTSHIIYRHITEDP